MRQAIRLTLLAVVALSGASCGIGQTISTTVNKTIVHRPGYSVEFVAGNPTSVLIDFAHGSDQELDVAHTLAVNRCALFGRAGGAVLDSINPRSDGVDRASFLCQ
jgi:hypothetical protein